MEFHARDGARSPAADDRLSTLRSHSSEDSDDSRPDKIEFVSNKRPEYFSTAIHEIGFIVTVVFSLMMSEYFTSGFNIILPHISSAIHIQSKDRTWPTAVTNLACGALLLPFSRLCDRFGSRMIFLTGHAWLCVWSVANGFSTNTIITIICRSMQGVGFAAFLPAGLALLGQVYRPGPRKNLVYCLYGAFACIGFYSGIFTAAISVEFLNWRWYFWIGAVIELLIAVVGYFAVPKDLNDSDSLVRMDWWGALTIAPGVALLIFAFTEGGHSDHGWRTPYICVCFVLGGLFLSAAVYTQGWISSQPLIPARIFKPTCMRRVLGVMLCCNGIWSIFLFYSSLYVNTVLEPPPTLAAAWYTPLAVGGIFLAIAGGMILHIVSSYILLLISGVGFLTCTLILALLPDQPSPTNISSASQTYWKFLFPAMCAGTIGINIMFSVTNVFCTSAVSRRDQALIGGVVNSLSYLGAALALGISDAIISVAIVFTRNSLGEQGQFRVAFWMGVCLAGAALCLASTARIGSARAELTVDEQEAADRTEKGLQEGPPMAPIGRQIS